MSREQKAMSTGSCGSDKAHAGIKLRFRQQGPSRALMVFKASGFLFSGRSLEESGSGSVNPVFCQLPTRALAQPKPPVGIRPDSMEYATDLTIAIRVAFS